MIQSFVLDEVQRYSASILPPYQKHPFVCLVTRTVQKICLGRSQETAQSARDFLEQFCRLLLSPRDKGVGPYSSDMALHIRPVLCRKLLCDVHRYGMESSAIQSSATDGSSTARSLCYGRHFRMN